MFQKEDRKVQGSRDVIWRPLTAGAWTARFQWHPGLFSNFTLSEQHLATLRCRASTHCCQVRIAFLVFQLLT